MSPNDSDSFFGSPDETTPLYDEVHISVTFTWDIPKVKDLIKAWGSFGKVKVGGPAYGDPGGDFISGLYLNTDVTITSRGCPNKCPFCFVPKREGKIRELPISPGRIVQDNNLLACSDSHLGRVFDMLKMQKKIDLSGGLEAGRITEDIVVELKKLRIYQIWTAFDKPQDKDKVTKAIELLRLHFNRNKVRCYVLIGYEGDTLDAAENRLRWVYDVGALPFAMLYHTHTEWKKLQRPWTRPAAMQSIMKKRTFEVE